jgi:hypothetical protein
MKNFFLLKYSPIFRAYRYFALNFFTFKSARKYAFHITQYIFITAFFQQACYESYYSLDYFIKLKLLKFFWAYISSLKYH